MRTLALIVVVGALIALLAVAVLGLPVAPVMGGYLFGVAWQVAVSIVMNTHNASVRDIGEYGDELAWMGGMDGRHGSDEFEAFHSSEVTHVIR